MSEEIELERLVVRLVGDGSDYKDMMEDASERSRQFGSDADNANRQASEAFSGTSDEVANAAQTMSAFDGINRGAGRNLAMTGRTVTQLGIGFSQVNPAIGQMITSMGLLTSTAGRTVATTARLGAAWQTVMTLALNPITWVAIPAAIASYVVWSRHAEEAKKNAESFKASLDRLNVSLREHATDLEGVGRILNVGGLRVERAPATPDEALEYAERRQKELDEALKEQDRAFTAYNEQLRLQQERKNRAEREVRETTKEAIKTPLSYAGLKNALNIASEIKYANQFQDTVEGIELVRKAQADYQAAQESATKATKRQKEAGDILAKDLLKQAEDMAQAKSRIGEKPEMKEAIDYWEKNKYKRNQSPEARTAYDAGLNAALVLGSARVTYAYEQEIKAGESRLRLIGLTGMALARQSAIEAAILSQKSQARAIALGEQAANIAKADITNKLSRELEQATIADRNAIEATKAAINPLDLVGQAAASVAGQMRLWKDSNRDAIDAEATAWEAHLRTAEAIKIQAGYMQQARSILDQYGDPLQRFVRRQTELHNLMKQGGFKGAEGMRAYEKSLRAAYGEAHRLWQEQFKMTKMSAIEVGSSDAAYALQEFRLGSTPIPGGQTNKPKDAQRDIAQNTRDTVTAVKNLTEAIKTRKSLEVSLANF